MRVARLVGLAALLLLVGFGLASAWQAYQVRSDLKAAEADVELLQVALKGDDLNARNQAAQDLTDHVTSASDRTHGFVWSLAEHAPVFGDDARAVTAISGSLKTLADGAIQPLLLTVDSVDGITGNGRIDVDKLETIKEPIQTARQSAVDAQSEVADLDSDDYVGAVSSRLDEYRDRLGDLVRSLKSGEKALKTLPAILGAEGPRDYLLVFQNNAEIRATGGIPGSWAQVHADNGALEIVKQGTSGEFRIDEPERDALPISDAERAVYSDLLGVFWQDTTFTPNWPRAAELLSEHFSRRFPAVKLDGELSIDPVAISYLLAGTGPVAIDSDVTIDSGNAVEQLLSAPYLRLDNEQQDAFFAQAARSVFAAVTGDLASPIDLLRGLRRAVDERRLLATMSDPDVSGRLPASIKGELPTDDGNSPLVAVALNDATASKMSYFLRYQASMSSTGCEAGRQTLSGNLDLTQTITDEQARTLPETVTGSGDIGIPLGSQLVVVRLYGPTGGTIGDLTVDGGRVSADVVVELDGREVATLVAQLSGPDVVPITWTMTTGEGQTDDGTVQVTPGVAGGSSDSPIESSC